MQQVGHDGSRRQKRVQVLHALRRSPGLSKVALSRELGFSPGTVRLVTDELETSGLLVSTGLDSNTGGRPSGRLALNSSSPLVIGVDLGEVEMRLALLNMAGEVVLRRRTAFDQRDRRVSVEHIASEIAALAAGAGGPVAAVGVAVPGHVDAATGRVLYATNLGWRDVDLSAELAGALDLPVLLDRNTNAAMLAEQWWAPGSTTDPVLFVTLGSGIGVAIRTDGGFLRGAGGAAGELGHIVIDKQGPECSCGSRGCLETVASSRAVRQRYAELHDHRRGAAEIGEVIGAARDGDAVAQQVLTEAGEYLAEGLAVLVNLLNPAVIVLGGELMEAERELLPVIRTGVRRRALAYPADQVRIVPSHLREDGPLIGAATLVLDAIFQQDARVERAVS